MILRNLGDLKRMCQACAVMIPLRGKEHLRLMLETAERLAVQESVPIPLVRRAEITFLFRTIASVSADRAA